MKKYEIYYKNYNKKIHLFYFFETKIGEVQKYNYSYKS